MNVPGTGPGARQLAAVPYAGLGLNRATGRRDDPSWVAGLAADPRARVWPLWRDQCLVAGDPPAPCHLPAAAIGGAEIGGTEIGGTEIGGTEIGGTEIGGTGPARLVLLGLAAGIPEFAADLSELALGEALASAGADDVADIRSLFTGLPASQAAALAYARGLLYANRQQRYCGRCGATTQPRNAGHLQACTNDACGALLFPRIEPAVIAIVETSTAPSRCLLARHRASKAGGYSLLAGFVELGESLEDAVRREIREEAGVILDTVRYAGSQPWPFPAGLMVGFRATAPDMPVSVDGQEIQEARWFTRGELRDYAERTGWFGRADSIDGVMLAAWLAEGAA